MKKIIFLLCSLFISHINAQVIMTLQQCLDAAKTHNRQLQNMALSITSATEQKKETYTKYFPKISANITAFQAFDKIIKGDGTYPPEIAAISSNLAPLAGQPYSYKELSRGYNATISVTQPIYAGGKITAANQLAQIQRDVCILQHSLTEKDVLQKITENYWKIVTIKYKLNTLDIAEKQVAAFYQQVEQYVKAGVTTRNDLLKVCLRQQELASNRLKLNNAESVLKLLLAQQIGIFDQEIDVDTTLLQEKDPQSIYLPAEQAVGKREELNLAMKSIDAQRQKLKLERSKNLPTVAAGAMGYHVDLGGVSTRLSHLANTSITNGLVFGTVNIPLSSWWGGGHAIKRMKVQLQQSQNDAMDAREKLAVDIAAAWNNLTESYSQIGLARTSVEQACENLRIETDRYKAGTETLTDLLTAEALHRQAQNNLAEALATYQIRQADYMRKIK